MASLTYACIPGHLLDPVWTIVNAGIPHVLTTRIIPYTDTEVHANERLLRHIIELTSTATAAELAKAHKWTRAKFEGVAETKPDEGYLKVNLDAGMIQRSEVTTTGYGLYAIASRPLRIADRDFERGLHFPSEGEVVGSSAETCKDF